MKKRITSYIQHLCQKMDIMNKGCIRHTVLLTIVTVICCLWTSCEGVGKRGLDNIYTTEQKAKIESGLRQLNDLQLDGVTKVSTKNVGDSIFLRHMVANRLMAHRMRHQANFLRAIDYGRIAYNKAVLAEDTIEIVMNLNEIGTNFRRIGALSGALEHHYKALAIAGLYSDTADLLNKRNLTYAYNGIGNIAMSMHNNNEAKRCFQRGLQLEKEIDSKVGLAINYANLGSIMQDECKYDSALYYYELSYKMNQLCGSTLGQALCHNHFGSLFEVQNLLDSAKVRYQKGYTMLTSLSDKWHWLVSCVSLGRVLLKMGQLEEAEKYLLNARDIATTADATESLGEAHELLAELYRKKGDFNKALDEVAKTRELNDAIRSEILTSTFNNAQIAYIRDKESREVDILNDRKLSEDRQNKMWKIISAVIIVVLLIIIVQMWITSRFVKKRNMSLKKMQADKNKVFEVISSEMRQPAMEQRNTLQYIIENQDELTRQERKEYLIQAYGSAVKQVDLLSNLLTWSHIKLGDMKPNVTLVNLCQVVTEAIDILHLSAKQKNISFVLPYDNGLMVKADSEMLMCIVLNLISNAIKYSYAGGEISIKYKEDAFTRTLCVEDRGIGMDEKQLASVLKPTQIDSDVSYDKIAGLGLRISLALAKSNNGKLTAESRQHRGTMFMLTLPKG